MLLEVGGRTESVCCVVMVDWQSKRSRGFRYEWGPSVAKPPFSTELKNPKLDVKSPNFKCWLTKE